GNVAALKLAWSFSTGVVRGHEAAPIIANNTMYIVTPYPNIVYAIDLTQPAGPVKWKYESNPSSSSQGVACCDVVIVASSTPTAGFFSTHSTTIRSSST